MTSRPEQPERECLRRLVILARNEDLGGGDVTGRLVPAEARATGRFVARQALTVCGAALLAEIAHAYDTTIVTDVLVEEGAEAAAGDALATWAGPARTVMAAERVALNFLQHLSGIATATRAYVRAVEGTGAAIYDTRKTTPAWRALEKFAVRAGGGRNHRIGLYDAVLVKDNHLAVLAGEGEGDPVAALAGKLPDARRALGEKGFVEIEVDTLDQLASALKLPVDVILLDNMPPAALREAVAMRDDAQARGRILLEASGGITLANVRQAAETGVERIAIGAITHSAPAVDIALDIQFD